MKIMNTEAFGKAIAERRKKLKYTQQYVSDVSGLSVSFISDLENGKATAELAKSLLLANLLGLDMELNAREK